MLTLLLAAALITTPPEAPPLDAPPVETTLPAAPLPEISSPTNSFSYLSLGATTPLSLNPHVYVLAMPDIFIGKRHFFTPHHALDYGMGLDAHIYMQMLYGQVSYLYHFKPTDSLYLGAGITLGVIHLPKDYLLPPFFPWANVPLTIGYHFSTKNHHHRFIQLQVTFIRTGTISYGFGF